MYIIAGLGNPGRKYVNTRHNAGFMTIDRAAKKYDISVRKRKHGGLEGKGVIGGEEVILLKPHTYMNSSGESIRAAVDYYKIDARDKLIVISDDISLDVGALRIRKKGSAGGHNGLKNIILKLGHDEFKRIRIGVGGKPRDYELIDYVLGHFSKEDMEFMDEGIEQAVEALEVIITKGCDAAMNQFNKKGR